MQKLFLSILLLPLLVSTACGADNQNSRPETVSSAPVTKTIINDRAALEKLLGNTGVTLQWISWDYRGPITASWQGDTLYLLGEQKAKDGNGRVAFEGQVVSIDAVQFVFRGTISISDTPDAGRQCKKTGNSIFAITQNRPYWRMREFEWCDYLTDYIDIYF